MTFLPSHALIGKSLQDIDTLLNKHRPKLIDLQTFTLLKRGITMKEEFNIVEYIKRYYELSAHDPNHRYKSWEHCYSYFTENQPNIEIACLHLAFFLASWGMYRGSSFLLQKDYLIHKKAVEHLLSIRKSYGQHDYSRKDPKFVEELHHLINLIKKIYVDSIEIVNGTTQQVNVTNTLATKILLGSLGCVPAFDRFFVEGLRLVGLGYYNLDKRKLTSIFDFYIKHQGEFDEANKYILNKGGINYPPMKLVDMFFWQIGYEQAADIE